MRTSSDDKLNLVISALQSIASYPDASTIEELQGVMRQRLAALPVPRFQPEPVEVLHEEWSPKSDLCELKPKQAGGGGQTCQPLPLKPLCTLRLLCGFQFVSCCVMSYTRIGPTVVGPYLLASGLIVGEAGQVKCVQLTYIPPM